ncbi:MAG: type II toxin-antitoxin system YafQ family toxin [Paracoccaceae bacterium]|nr:type II toxin-antitoxin system YafQ family toxin [Paracoccaceae bacterium]MDP7186557.1 type II toxin-antitoxin system YafQ family toxin [Paracoccaceae bacterium]
MKTKGKKRAHPPRACDFTRQFHKDWQRLDRSGRFDMGCLKQVMMLIVTNDAPLGPEWRDHALVGDWADHRECHVGGDFLLIYRVDDNVGKSGMVVFVRAGTHAELFRE